MTEKPTLNLDELKAVRVEETAISRLAALLPKIEAHLQAGGSHAAIHEHLKKQGFDVSLGYYKNMLNRIRRRNPVGAKSNVSFSNMVPQRDLKQDSIQAAKAADTRPLAATTRIESHAITEMKSVPLKQLKPIAKERPKKFEFDPFSDIEKLW